MTFSFYIVLLGILQYFTKIQNVPMVLLDIRDVQDKYLPATETMHSGFSLILTSSIEFIVDS
jgi:hypothetical protein